MVDIRHTYESPGGVTVVLILPDTFEPPEAIKIRRASDGRDGIVRRKTSRRSPTPAKRKPTQAKPQTPMTAGWEPPAEAVEALATECPSVNVTFETAQFVDWAIGIGQARADWVASWRGWIRRTHARNVEKGWKPLRAAAPAGETPEQKWCREHGVTVDEYRARKDDRAWVEMIKRRGKVA